MKLPLLLAVCVAFIAVSASAQDLADGPVESVFERDRGDYAAEGVPLGGWIMRPAVNAQYLYDDNVFATDGNEQSDQIFVFSGGARLESNWNVHRVVLNAGAIAGLHEDNDNEDFEDYNLGLYGELDIRRSTQLKGGIAYVNSHEERTSPNDVNGIEPTDINAYQADALLTHEAGRFLVDFGAGYEQLDFSSVRTSLGTLITNEDRDREEYRVFTKLGYEFQPTYNVFLLAGWNERDYDATLPLNRDSSGYDVSLGLSRDLTGKLRLSLFGGFLEQEYDSENFSDIENATFGGDLLWNVTGLTSLKAGVIRTVEETISLDYSGFLATRYTAAIEHELRRNVLLGLDIAYQLDEYEPNGNVLEREDDNVEFGALAQYFIREGIGLNLAYDYASRDSNAAFQDFSINRIMLSTSLAL